LRIKVLGTGSQGNAYLLYNEQEALLVECGVAMRNIKIALDFNLSKLVGCVMTHEHGDHSKGAKEALSAGVKIYSTAGTFAALNLEHHHNAEILDTVDQVRLGGFLIKNFDVKHDAAEPSGFLINHEDFGNLLFLTDTYYCPYIFPQLNNIIIEANYSKRIIDVKLSQMEFLKNRVLQSHMSLETCIRTLKANNLTTVNNILLIHLSDSNSNEKEFQEEVTRATGLNVSVAHNGMDIPFDLIPF
jgi:phosphoribosyl 1,2-cyclic phosphodiesterase